MPIVPIFPLPTVVLFPGVALPLHIFEPRYRTMVADALDGDRQIGMVLLRPGWEHDYEGTPPVYVMGCIGVIVQHTRLADGRYTLVLQGLERFRITGEERTRAYRRAAVEPMPDPALDEMARHTLRELRGRIAAHLASSAPMAGAAGLAALSDADFVHVLAHHLDFEPIEKQALLERDTLCLRAHSLLDLLEIQRLANSAQSGSDLSH
jgi:uncharacterized protein